MVQGTYGQIESKEFFILRTRIWHIIAIYGRRNTWSDRISIAYCPRAELLVSASVQSQRGRRRCTMQIKSLGQSYGRYWYSSPAAAPPVSCSLRPGFCIRYPRVEQPRETRGDSILTFGQTLGANIHPRFNALDDFSFFSKTFWKEFFPSTGFGLSIHVNPCRSQYYSLRIPSSCAVNIHIRSFHQKLLPI